MGWSGGPAEREQRVAVVRDAWISAYAHIFTRAEIEGIFDGALEAQGSWVSARLAPAGTLAARLDGRLVGVADLGMLRSGDGELAGVYVRPEHQGRGVGTKARARIDQGMEDGLVRFVDVEGYGFFAGCSGNTRDAQVSTP